MTRVADLPKPRTAAQRDTFTVNHLSPGTTYHFLLKVGDEIPNWSGASNKAGVGPAVAPARVIDLVVARALPSGLVLRWTATGDDGTRGTAAQYSIREATDPAATWDEMDAVPGAPASGPSGQVDSMAVGDLNQDTEYYFRLQAGDDVSLWSSPSNQAHGKTLDVVPPASVTDLTIVETTAVTVTVRWTEPGDNGNEGHVSQHDLRYSSSPITGSNWGEATRADGTFSNGDPGSPMTHVVSGLEQERTYFFALKAADEVPNWSDLSNVVTTTTPDQTPPATVADLVAGLPTATTIKLTWTSPGDDGVTGTATQYDVRYSTALITASNWVSATPVQGIPVPLAGGSIQTFTVEELLQGTTYYFALKTKDEHGNESGLSNVVSSSTLDVIPPEAISDLTAVSATGNSVSLRWTAPGDDGSTGRAAVYDVRYSTAAINDQSWSSTSQVTGEPVPQPHGTVENFAVLGLQGGTPYYFAIKASDDAENWSSLSNVVTAATTGQLAPAAITDLMISQVGLTSLRLSWTAAGDDGTVGTASQYDVRYATTAITQQNWASASSVVGTPTPHTAGTAEYLDVGSLQQDTAYYFAVKTADEVPNWSDLSDVPYATTLDQTPPAAVADLQVTGTTATTISFRWTATGDNGTSGTATQYDVRYTTGSLNQSTWNSATQASGEPAPGIAGTTQTLTITNLQHAATYRFAVRASDDAGNVSELSNVVVAATPPPIPPPGPVWIAAGNVRLGQVGLPNAEPVNDYYIEGFFIDRYEVSNATYKAFIDAGGYTTEAYWSSVGWAWRVANSITLPDSWNSNVYHGGGIAGNEQFPANGVSWFGADAYCRWAGGRLPTEAEWEKAAKGGCETHGYPGTCDASDTPTYPWGEGISGPQANYGGSGDPYESIGYTTPVGYYDGSNHGGYQTINSPSPYGLYDVAGNVWEWCSTKYAAYPYNPNDGRENPPVSYSECCRALRGGSYYDVSYYLQSAFWDSYDGPTDRHGYIGFRCVRAGSQP